MRWRLEETKALLERHERLRQVIERQERLEQFMPQLPPVPVSLDEAVEEAVEALPPSPLGTPVLRSTVPAVPPTKAEVDAVEVAIATYERSKATLARLRKETTK
jgi:hypothetical protein